MNQPLNPITGKPLPTKKEIVDAIADLQQVQPHQPADDILITPNSGELKKYDVAIAEWLRKTGVGINQYAELANIISAMYATYNYANTQKAQQAGARAERLAIVAGLPEYLPKGKLDIMYEDGDIDWNKYCSELGYTQAINQVKQLINERSDK